MVIIETVIAMRNYRLFEAGHVSAFPVTVRYLHVTIITKSGILSSPFMAIIDNLMSNVGIFHRGGKSTPHLRDL